MHSCDSLELDGRVDKRFAQEYMGCVDQIEAGGVCFGMQQKAFDLRHLQYGQCAGPAMVSITDMEKLTPGLFLNFSVPPFRSMPVNPILN